MRHTASGQLVGVDGATARSAAVRPVAARATVCGHGVRGRVLGPAVAIGLQVGTGQFRRLWGATSPCLSLCNIDARHFAWVVATLVPKSYRFSKMENGPQNENDTTRTLCGCSLTLCLLPTYFLFPKI